MKPTVSVIVPTCHRNDLLMKCLDCLAPGAQTFYTDSYEVVVTDDGSRSTAEAVVRDLYPWAKWVEGPKLGPAANRNHGMKHSKGNWLAFTDDDCLPSPNWLTSFVDHISKETSVYEGRTLTDENRGLFYTAPINQHGGYLWSCNFMIASQLFQDVGGFDSAMPTPHLEDIDLRMRLASKDTAVMFVSDAVVLHPQRPLKPILRQVLDHESAFYMSRKHNVSVNKFGLGPYAYVYTQALHIFKGSNSPLNAMHFFLTRTLVEACMLPLFCAKWRRKYS